MKEFFHEVIQQPEICIGTDLMTGFPGEEEADFQETCETFSKGHFHTAMFLLTLNVMEQLLRDYQIKCPWKL